MYQSQWYSPFDRSCCISCRNRPNVRCMRGAGGWRCCVVDSSRGAVSWRSESSKWSLELRGDDTWCLPSSVDRRVVNSSGDVRRLLMAVMLLRWHWEELWRPIGEGIIMVLYRGENCVWFACDFACVYCSPKYFTSKWSPFMCHSCDFWWFVSLCRWEW